jgi:hypothetical protein
MANSIRRLLCVVAALAIQMGAAVGGAQGPAAGKLGVPSGNPDTAPLPDSVVAPRKAIILDVRAHSGQSVRQVLSNKAKIQQIREQVTKLGGKVKVNFGLTIDLANSKVTDANLQFLAKLKSRTLYDGFILNNTKLTDTALPTLVEATDGGVLVQLQLANTMVSDEGLKTLSRLDCLYHLDLSGTKITDKGLVHLTKLQCHVLELANTGIGDIGLETIGETDSLHRLYL